MIRRMTACGRQTTHEKSVRYSGAGRRLTMAISMLLIGMTIVVGRSGSACAEPANAPWNIEYGMDYSDEAEQNAKFNEYRYNRDEKPGLILNIHRHMEGLPSAAGKNRYDAYNPFALPGGATRYFDVAFQGRTPEDVNLSLNSGSYGVYKFSVDMRRMGHNFAYRVRTPYSGTGSSSLTLSDQFQTDMQGQANDTGRATVANAALSTSPTVDVSLKRDRVRSVYQRILTKWPVTLNLAMDHEIRDGSRPFGGSFGHSYPVEIMEPLDFRTTNLSGGAEYATGMHYAQLNVSRSYFHNQNASISFDNTVRITDAANNAAVGRVALPPDNTADNISILLTQRLPHHTRLTTRGSYGRMRQTENVIPMTTNTLNSGHDTFIGKSPANLKIDKKQFDVAVSSSVGSNIHVKASFAYDQHDNKSPLLATPTHVNGDGSASKAGETTVYVSYIKRETELEAEFEIGPRTTVGFAYENENASFKNGSATAELENTYKITMINRREKLNSRLIIERAKKKSDYPDYPRYLVEVPTMRKFYAASRDRNAVTFLATYFPTESLSLNGQYIFGKDDYPQSQYGMQNTKRQIFSLDADFEPDDRTTFNVFYTYELYRTRQRSHDWATYAPTDPRIYPDTYSQASSWTLLSKDRWHTFGGVIRSKIIADVLDIRVSASHARIDGLTDFESPVGTTDPLDRNRFTPLDFLENDETRKSQAEVQLNMRVPKRSLLFTLGYLFEKWEIKDWEYDGTKQVVAANDGRYLGLFLDSLYKSYSNVHTFYFTTRYQF